MNRITGHRVRAIALIAAALAAPVAAQRRELAMLDQIQPGQWELRIRDGATRRLCLQDGRRLIQLRHDQLDCERVTVNDTPSQVSVQYTCRGHGYGLTDIRRESPQLLQIDSRGVDDGLPFEFSAEARRVGAC